MTKTGDNLEVGPVIDHVEEPVLVVHDVIGVEHVYQDVVVELIGGRETDRFGPLLADAITASVTGHVVHGLDGFWPSFLSSEDPLQCDVGGMAEVDVEVSESFAEVRVDLEPALASFRLCHA